MAGLNYLTVLDLCHNPLLSKRFYRIQVIYALSHLRTLDGQNLKAEEREQADNFFGTFYNINHDLLLPFFHFY